MKQIFRAIEMMCVIFLFVQLLYGNTGSLRDFYEKTEYAVGQHPYVVASADVDLDGDADIVVSNWYSFFITVLFNNGDGTFPQKVNIPTLGQATHVITTDIDNDGDDDLVVASANYPSGGQGSITIMINNGNGTFQNPYGYYVSSAASTVCAGDYDNDGDKDLAVTNWYDATVTIFFNTGGGLFTRGGDYLVGAYPHELVAADFDGDGNRDIATANTNYGGDNGSVTILKNTGQGIFELIATITVDEHPQALSAADIDSDNDIDIVIANRNSNNVFILKNDGGAFEISSTVEVGVWPTGITPGDFNQDGYVDFAVTNSYAYTGILGTISYLTNNGNGEFSEESFVNVNSGPRTLARGDLNGDGFMDLAVTSWDENSVTVLLNENRKFRTLKADTSLSKKAKKISIVNATFQTSPNHGTVLQALFNKIGKSGAPLLGIPQNDKALAKKYAWIHYKNAQELSKLYLGEHNGPAYPLDYTRKNDKIRGKLKGALKPTSKKYNNIAIEQGVLFKVNLLASAYGITPRGLGNVVFDSAYILGGRNLKGYSLAAISLYFDSLMTYWELFGINNQAAYENLDKFSRYFLKGINEGFSTDLNPSSYTLNAKSYIDNKPYPLFLKGTKDAVLLGFLSNVTGKTDESKLIGSEMPRVEIPTKIELNQNYPNPFNPTTTIEIGVPEELDGVVATMKIFNTLGQEVFSPIENEQLEYGTRSVIINASTLPSGTYFYRLQTSNKKFVLSKKMLLLK
ncbi:MAG: T9SS type A sorting domain-containing protein [Ignavibacteriales bacterium]|nr:T9SS type A sorting domain-containing protein [Ignavibacteriales bacterium]